MCLLFLFLPHIHRLGQVVTSQRWETVTGSDTYLLLAAGGEGGGGGGCLRSRAASPMARGEKLCLGECVSAKVREPRREPRILDVSGRGGRWAVTRRKEGEGPRCSHTAPTGWQWVCSSGLKVETNDFGADVADGGRRSPCGTTPAPVASCKVCFPKQQRFH